MAFFFGCFFATWIGRNIGWAISRRLLYPANMAVCGIACFVWGSCVAYALRFFILSMHPGLLLKIFGYGAGAYVSIPNYGLLNESTIPESELQRHVVIKGVPFVVFIVASLVFAFIL